MSQMFTMLAAPPNFLPQQSPAIFPQDLVVSSFGVLGVANLQKPRAAASIEDAPPLDAILKSEKKSEIKELHCKH